MYKESLIESSNIHLILLIEYWQTVNLYLDKLVVNLPETMEQWKSRTILWAFLFYYSLDKTPSIQEGTDDGGMCDERTSEEAETVAGQCHCKTYVSGSRCDHCTPGIYFHWCIIKSSCINILVIPIQEIVCFKVIYLVLSKSWSECSVIHSQCFF